jgi:hypothetical protein
MSAVIRSRRALAIAGAASLALFGLVAFPLTPAGATTAGTAVLTAGSLGITAPATVSFAATLNGLDQAPTATQTIDELDSTGSGAGWNVTATSTTFKTAGGDLLATTAVTEPLAPTRACDASSACTLATTNVSYPYTMPAATVAPTATHVYNATAATGLGNQTSTHSIQLAVPSGTKSGSYTSTWTYSIVSGP